MINCFTEVYKYLNVKYDIPKGWKEYHLDVNNLDLYVEQQKRFLARKDHISFFSSFCSPVKSIKKDDVVLTRTSIGCAINQFMYWVYSEDENRIVHSKIDKNCLIMRIDNG
jgi:hypothetical protein